jgi:hypothetical protein
MPNFVPKSIRNFKKRNAYNTKRDAGIGLRFWGGKIGHPSFIVISMNKLHKPAASFGIKIALDSKSAQARTEKEAEKTLNGLYPGSRWANEWATTGGMLYRIWPTAPGKAEHERVLRAIRHIVLFADRLVE